MYYSTVTWLLTKKKSSDVRSGDLAGQFTGPLRPILFSAHLAFNAQRASAHVYNKAIARHRPILRDNGVV